MKKLVIPALIALSLTACNESTSFSNKNKEGTVIATVNGINIVKEEVDSNFATLPKNLTKGKETEIRMNIVDQLVKYELVLQNADKINLRSDAEFKKLYDNMSRNFVYNYMVNRAIQSAVTEEALQAEYEKNKAKYVYPTIKASHILQKTEEDAKAIITMLNDGQKFDKLATDKSTGPSAKNKGELGWFKQNDMVPAFAKVAFALKKGEYTKTPVHTQFGWHVILVEDTKADNIATFDMVKQPLKQNLTNKAMQGYLNGLTTSAKVEMVAAHKPVALPTATKKETATK